MWVREKEFLSFSVFSLYGSGLVGAQHLWYQRGSGCEVVLLDSLYLRQSLSLVSKYFIHPGSTARGKREGK